MRVYLPRIRDLSTQAPLRKSRFMRPIRPAEIDLGQAASHSPMLLQAPNPSRSACFTIDRARVVRSGCPCGSRPRCAILAAVNSAAEPLGQAAAQAPHPMQAAASIDDSASRLRIGMVLASGALPVATLT